MGRTVAEECSGAMAPALLAFFEAERGDELIGNRVAIAQRHSSTVAYQAEKTARFMARREQKLMERLEAYMEEEGDGETKRPFDLGVYA